MVVWGGADTADDQKCIQSRITYLNMKSLLFVLALALASEEICELCLKQNLVCLEQNQCFGDLMLAESCFSSAELGK